MIGRAPRLVVAATVTFGGLMAFWSVLTPLTEAPDEPAHLGLVLHVADTGDYPAYDELQHTEGLFDLCVDFAVSANWCRTDAERAADLVVRDHPAGEAPPKHGRPHADDPGFHELEPGRMNQMPQHPPLYYRLMAAGLQAERLVVPGELSIDTELALLRLLNILLLLPLPALAWLTARRLGAAEPVGLVAALLPLAVPQLTHIGATLNNDNLFVVLVAALVALLAGVVKGDRTARTAALVGVALGLALLTKGFGVVLVPLVVLAYWRAVRPALGALGLGLAVGGWWYAANLRTTGRIMPSIEDSVRLNPRTRPAGFEPQVGEYLHSTVGRLVEGFWGAFGWRQVELPTEVSLAATLAGLVAMALAFRRPAPAGRSALAVMLVPLLLLGGFVIVRSAVIYSETGRLAFQQGRYLFGGLTGAAVVVAVGLHERLGPRAVTAATGAVVGMQALGVASCLTGWWDADKVGLLGALRAVVAWSGWPDPVVVAILGLAPVQLGWLIAVSRRRSRAAAGPGPTPEAADPAGRPEPAGPEARTSPPAATLAAARSGPASGTAVSADPPPGS